MAPDPRVGDRCRQLNSRCQRDRPQWIVRCHRRVVVKKIVIIGIGIAIAIALAVGISGFSSTTNEASVDVGIQDEVEATIKTPEEEPTPQEIIVDAVEDIGVETEPGLEEEEEEPTPLEIIIDVVESIGTKDKGKPP